MCVISTALCCTTRSATLSVLTPLPHPHTSSPPSSLLLQATFRAMVAAGHHPRDFAYCGLIAAHSISGSTTAALRIRLRMQREGVALTVHVYNALIAACERAGRWDQALELHRSMTRDGIEGNGVTAQLMHSVGRKGVASVESAQLTAAALSAAMAAAGTLLIRSGMF